MSLCVRSTAVKFKPAPEPLQLGCVHKISSAPVRVTVTPGASGDDGSFQAGRQYGGGRDTSQTLPKTPSTADDVLSFIVSRYMQFINRAFMPFRFPAEAGLARIVKQSSLTYWSMYIGAKIIHNLLNNTEWKDCAVWILRLHQVVLDSTSPDADNRTADTRLLCCQYLSVFAFLISKPALGYSILKECSNLFLELVGGFPELCSRNSTISLQGALWSSHFEICRFAFYDTLTSLAFATPPLIRYDTTHCSNLMTTADFRILESVYGCPADILVFLGRINAWRVSRWMGEAELNPQEWKQVRDQLESWHPLVEYIDESFEVIGRLTVHEAWRQSALIYVYMGMCMVNSADPRIEAAVRQVAQLASTIEPGAALERHIFIPCLIAGVAARQEKHRATLRSKIYSARGQNVWLLPGPDFVAVLDHLWHGVGAGGTPTTWEDYVDSRCAMLPLDITPAGP